MGGGVYKTDEGAPFVKPVDVPGESKPKGLAKAPKAPALVETEEPAAK